jgi:hypothetical protein
MRTQCFMSFKLRCLSEIRVHRAAAFATVAADDERLHHPPETPRRRQCCSHTSMLKWPDVVSTHIILAHFKTDG